MTVPPPGCDRRFPVYILAGGKSRRFGSDKARAGHEGEPLVTRVAAALGPIAASTQVVAARPGAYDDLGLGTISDRISDRGPLGGLLTALYERRHRPEHEEWLLLTACDWLWLDHRWVGTMAPLAAAPAQAVVFRSDRIEALFGLYHSSIEAVVEARVREGRLAMHGLLDAIETTYLPAPQDWSRAVNVNRPSDLG